MWLLWPTAVVLANIAGWLVERYLDRKALNDSQPR